MPAADALADLLAGTYLDAETGERLGTSVRAIAIGDDLDGGERVWVESLALGERFAVVSDRDTHRVLGARVERALRDRFAVHSVVLPARPHPDGATIDAIVAAVGHPDAIIAVGSGTLNDLCKMAALRLGVPQLTFATAPSMNGYTSVSASIIEASGLKRSVRAAAPVGVFFDLRVLAAAPVRMIRAGLGDSACRSTAQADWLLAHLVLGQPYREVPFALLARDEAQLFADPAALVRGDLAAMRTLVRTLVASGFGMTLANGSFPASQGEHMLAHYAELVAPGVSATTLHGEQTGVTAVMMAELQRELFARDQPPVLAPTRLSRDAVLAHFGAAVGEVCWAEFLPRVIDAARADELTARLAREWDAIRARISAASVGVDALRGALNAAGCEVIPSALGWSGALVDDAWQFARATRNRYTALDLAHDLAQPLR